MEDEDYVMLQTLLAKLRVLTFRKLYEKDAVIKNRDKQVRIIRSIDYLRNNITFKREDELAEYKEEQKRLSDPDIKELSDKFEKKNKNFKGTSWEDIIKNIQIISQKMHGAGQRGDKN